MRYQTDKNIRSEWFGEHVAKKEVFTDSKGNTITEINWRKKNGSSINYVHYLIKGGVLYICGDLGEAIHKWYGRPGIDLAFFRKPFGIDYFSEKCLASETGRGHRDWEEETAKKTIQFSFETDAKDNDELYNSNKEKEKENRETYVKNQWVKFNEANRYRDPGALESEFGWNTFVSENRHYMDEAFGQDWWEMGLPGDVPALRMRSHLIGLQMAHEQLTANEKADMKV